VAVVGMSGVSIVAATGTVRRTVVPGVSIFAHRPLRCLKHIPYGGI
jgi:hypothetical protein